MARRRSRRRRILQTLANYLAYFIARGLVEVVERIPYRAAHFAGRMAGRTGFFFGGRERRRALEHLSQAFPALSSVERLGIARRSFENMTVSMITAPVLGLMPDRKVRKIVADYDGVMDRLTELLARGKGLVALSGHVGNWESSGSLIARSPAHPLNVVGNRLNFEPFNRLWERVRRHSRYKVIVLAENNWDVIRALKRGEIVAILPDQDIRFLPGVFVEFFGREAYTPVGPVFVARLARAPLVPFFLVHEGRGFRFIWGEEIHLERTDDLDQDLRINTQRWSQVMEDVIRRFPDQWAWNHRRWKTRPGDPKAGIPK